jgi:hypothetical protein
VALRGADFCSRSVSGLESIWRSMAELHRSWSELREPVRHAQAADHAVVGASLLAIRACAVPKKSPASWLLQGGNASEGSRFASRAVQA